MIDRAPWSSNRIFNGLSLEEQIPWLVFITAQHKEKHMEGALAQKDKDYLKKLEEDHTEMREDLNRCNRSHLMAIIAELI